MNRNTLLKWTIKLKYSWHIMTWLYTCLLTVHFLNTALKVISHIAATSSDCLFVTSLRLKLTSSFFHRKRLEKKISEINTSLLAYTIPAIHERNTLQLSVAVKMYCNYPCKLYNHGSLQVNWCCSCAHQHR
jgi:hypothetical protein